MKTKTTAPVYEAFGGMTVISCGKRKNGKPNNIMIMEVLVVMSKSDAKALTKAHPRLKFFERKSRPRGSEPIK